MAGAWPSSSAIPKAPSSSSPGRSVNPLGFDDEKRSCRSGHDPFRVPACSTKYFAFPSRFLRSSCAGSLAPLKPRGGRVGSRDLARRHDPVVESGISAEHLSLFATPAINLFPRGADRIHLSEAPTSTRRAGPHAAHRFRSALRCRRSRLAPAWKWSGEFRPFYAPERRKGTPPLPFIRCTAGSGQNRQKGVRSTYVSGEVFFPRRRRARLL